MRVRLLSNTANPELLCAAAAMTSFKKEGATEAMKKLDSEKTVKTIRRVTGYGHYSVLEHAYFTFSLEEVSRVLTHQLVRHRIASYTQQSQRYVPYNTIEHYVVPRTILSQIKAKEIFEEALAKVSEAYEKLLSLHVPKEDARFILPNAAKTNIVVTMNARELRHFFNLRCCERSQWEIKETAVEMLRQVKKAAPVLFEKAGPSCVEFGYCPERELKPESCDIQNLKKRFSNL